MNQHSLTALIRELEYMIVTTLTMLELGAQVILILQHILDLLNHSFTFYSTVPTNCTNGEIQLLFGATKSEGTVEICIDKLWGSICDTSWGREEVKVTCKQLGFLSYGGKL